MNKKKIIFLITTFFIMSLFISIGIYAIIASTSTRSKITVNSDTITATATYSSSTNNYTWTYAEAGDAKSIITSTQNNTNTILHNYYNISSTSSNDLLKAILVYLNNNYVGTLNEVIAYGTKIEEDYGFISLNSTKSDTFRFELHQAADGSMLDNQSNVSITLTTYTENADYYNYIYVKTESEFKKAIDDINSDLFTETPIIILCDDISLSDTYSITNYTKIYMNDKTLSTANGSSGSLTLNDTNTTDPDALLEILGTGTLSATVTLGDYYDEEGSQALVSNYIKNKIGEGVNTNTTTNILGYYAFYNNTITSGTTCTYTKPNLIAPNTANEYYSKVDYITVDGEKVEFKVRGSKTALIASTLAHLPSSNEVISNDLFLPTSIPSENATITWSSSNEALITKSGKIVATKAENENATLFAEIRINNTVYTQSFSFKISVHNNEINFYKLVQEISPLIITNVYSSGEDANKALYYLPIVTEYNSSTEKFGDYDYRSSFKSPSSEEENTWLAYRDIGLVSLTYSMTTEQQHFDFITLGAQQGDNNTKANTIYLNRITLNNYAQITVTGNFGNEETYSTTIHVSIAVGSNTQILEKAFTQVAADLEEVSVLGNILKTRIKSGILNEKGDFSLRPDLDESYVTGSENPNDYSISYSASSDIISISEIQENGVVVRYDVSFDPTKFLEYETEVPIIATASYLGTTSKTRTFYITVPAALHIADFGTISIFNSTKYQVINQLPSKEISKATGYTTNGPLITNSGYDYILLRDIVGDSEYVTQYANNDDSYLDYLQEELGSDFEPVEGTQNLKYYTSDTYNSSTTDNAAYDFAKLIEWATGNTRATAGSVINDSLAISSLTNKKANAEEYLNADEIEVLKTYYQYYTGASDAQWNSIQSEVLSTAPGYIFTDSSLLNQVISALGAQSIASNFSTLFGKYMEVLQRYAVSTTTVNDNGRCIAPCQAQYNNGLAWYHSTQSGLSSFVMKLENDSTETITVTSSILAKGEYWYYGNNPVKRSGNDGVAGGLYANKHFESDKTSYITDPELQVLLIFWLNNMNRNTNFNDVQLALITEELSKGQAEGYYAGYVDTDFVNGAKALINAFYACLEIPTLFTTDGISKFIKYFYDNYNQSSITYKLKDYGTSQTTTFVSSVKESVPTVTNLDNLKSVLSYFSELNDLTINGNSNIKIFLSEYGLSTVFARVSLSNDKITSLKMSYLANSSVNFDLTNIKNFTNLQYIDLSNNLCIQSTNEFINVHRKNYTHVDIQNIGVEFKYQEFAIDNLASPTCTVIYTNASGNRTETNNNSKASCLANLSDFDEFITKYFYETTVVYDDSGNPQEVYWRIDDGNAIEGVSLGGSYEEISSISQMNQLVSPYYYCKQSFTYNNQSLTAGFLYKMSVVNSNVVMSIVGEYDEVDDLDELDDDISEPSVDFTDYVPTTELTETKNVLDAGTITYQSRTDFYTDNAINNQVTISSNYSYYFRNVGNTKKYLYYSNFIYNGTFLGGGTGTMNDYQYSYFMFLTATEVTNIQNRSYQTSTNVGVSINTAGSIDDTYYLGFIYNNELYLVGSTDDNANNNDDISVTKDLAKAHTVSLFNGTNNSNIRLFISDDCWIRLRGSNTHATYFNEKIDGNGSWTYGNGETQSISYQYVYNPSFTVRYNDGTSETINAYAAGYRIKKTADTDFTVTQTEKTIFDYYIPEDSEQYYYYTGIDTVATNLDGSTVTIMHNTVICVSPSFIYPVVTRTRSYRIVGTIYEWELWYCSAQWEYTGIVEGWGNPTGTISGNLIKSIKINTNANTNTYTASSIKSNVPADSSTRTNLAGWDNWDDSLESEWEYAGVLSLPYISYVENVTSSSVSSINDKKSIYSLIMGNYPYVNKYTGTTSSENVYRESIDGFDTNYTNNYYYQVVLNSDGYLEWQYYSDSLSNDTGTTMDSILTEANTHFKDYQYGKYYGMYYAYSGDSKYISSGIYVKQNYVYRIMPNDSNTAFEWVEIKPFVTDTSSNILVAMGTNNADVGDIFYSTENAFGHFQPDYYRIVLDGKTNIVNLVKYSDIIIDTDFKDNHTVIKLTNGKTKAISQGDYLGYSGTFTAEISAVFRTYDGSGNIIKEYVKTYKIKLVGFLT